MNQVPTIDSNLFTWEKGRGHATIEQLGLTQLPIHGFILKSHRTGDTRRMSEDGAVMEANEFFDGEGIALISSCGYCRVQVWH